MLFDPKYPYIPHLLSNYNRTHVTGSGSLNTIGDTDPMLVLSQMIRANEVLRICFNWSAIKKESLLLSCPVSVL